MENATTREGAKPEQSGRIKRLLAIAMQRAGQGLFAFLEIIGLREAASQIDQAGQIRGLKLYHLEFRKLISANNSFLETLAEVEQKLLGQAFVDGSYINRKIMRVLADIHAMADSLEIIAGRPNQALRQALDLIGADLAGMACGRGMDAGADLVRDLPRIDCSHADLSGGKMANLGEARNVLGLPTPDGFAVTTEAFRIFLEKNGIQPSEPQQGNGQESSDLQKRIMEAEVPELLQEAIFRAYDLIFDKSDPPAPLAVRSSALGEDSLLSFAGQFQSVLNVSREGLLNAYRRVVASLYSPEAIAYRHLHAVPGQSARMAVGFIAMIDAEASGVAFSRDPQDSGSEHVLIQAVRGLPVPLVEGSTSPEIITVESVNESRRISRIPSHQEFALVLSASGRLEQVQLDPSGAAQPCIGEEQAACLARWARRLEEHFGFPQDIEWALDRAGRLVLLQTRPLRLPVRQAGQGEPLPGAKLLLRGGEAASPGAGSGPAIHAHEDDPLDDFPEGGVLVAPRSSPKFIRIMGKTRAIVTDFGGTTGHMASLARELGIPTLLNTRAATQVIPRGATVTVDAANGFVYEGEVIVPDSITRESGGLAPAAGGGRQSPDLQLLRSVAELILPLNLIDPQSPEFRAENCRTLHDLARFMHEKSYESMFTIGQRVGDLRASSHYLEVFLPIDLYIIDLGGGLRGNPGGRKVRPEQILSAPLGAMLAGMLHEKIPRYGPRPMDLKGFFAVMMRHASTAPEEESTFRDPCYAIISDNYLNYTARVGYHFSVVDTYCSSSQNKNYISLFFGGGAADYVRRTRRARAIVQILKEHGFSARLTNDLVNARMGKAPRDVIVEKLKMTGSLLQFFRQMDAAMSSEEAVEAMRNAFLKGDYGLKELLPRR